MPEGEKTWKEVKPTDAELDTVLTGSADSELKLNFEGATSKEKTELLERFSHDATPEQHQKYGVDTAETFEAKREQIKRDIEMARLQEEAGAMNERRDQTQEAERQRLETESARQQIETEQKEYADEIEEKVMRSVYPIRGGKIFAGIKNFGKVMWYDSFGAIGRWLEDFQNNDVNIPIFTGLEKSLTKTITGQEAALNEVKLVIKRAEDAGTPVPGRLTNKRDKMEKKLEKLKGQRKYYQDQIAIYKGESAKVYAGDSRVGAELEGEPELADLIRRAQALQKKIDQAEARQQERIANLKNLKAKEAKASAIEAQDIFASMRHLKLEIMAARKAMQPDLKEKKKLAWEITKKRFALSKV